MFRVLRRKEHRKRESARGRRLCLAALHGSLSDAYGVEDNLLWTKDIGGLDGDDIMKATELVEITTSVHNK